MIENVFNALFGCRHKRVTRPITPVHKPGTQSGDSYVACLECGRRFHYDVTAMRVGAALPVPPASYRPISCSFQLQKDSSARPSASEHALF
jgi:hypothetical protein